MEVDFLYLCLYLVVSVGNGSGKRSWMAKVTVPTKSLLFGLFSPNVRSFFCPCSFCGELLFYCTNLASLNYYILFNDV